MKVYRRKCKKNEKEEVDVNEIVREKIKDRVKDQNEKKRNRNKSNERYIEKVVGFSRGCIFNFIAARV